MEISSCARPLDFKDQRRLSLSARPSTRLPRLRRTQIKSRESRESGAECENLQSSIHTILDGRVPRVNVASRPCCDQPPSSRRQETCSPPWPSEAGAGTLCPGTLRETGIGPPGRAGRPDFGPARAALRTCGVALVQFSSHRPKSNSVSGTPRRCTSPVALPSRPFMRRLVVA
jgi:hypothetical protein